MTEADSATVPTTALTNAQVVSERWAVDQVLSLLKRFEEPGREWEAVLMTDEPLRWDPSGAPTVEQVNSVVHFIDARGAETRNRIISLAAASDDDVEALRRLETALHVATIHTAGTLLYGLAKDSSHGGINAVCWESLRKTAESWAEHPDYPDFLSKPEWAR